MVHIEFSDDQEKPREQLKHPQGMTGPQPQPYVPPPASALPVQQAPNLPGMTPAPYGQRMSGPGPEATSPPVAPTQEQIDFEVAEFQAIADWYADRVRQAQKAPLTVGQAINYLAKIEKTFEVRGQAGHLPRLRRDPTHVQKGAEEHQGRVQGGVSPPSLGTRVQAAALAI